MTRKSSNVLPMSKGHDPLVEKIAQRLKEAREAAGLTQTQVAKALNTSQEKISRNENAKAKPDVEYVVGFARLYGVPTGWLLGLTDDRTTTDK